MGRHLDAVETNVSALADVIARRLWWGMLWFMRRRPIRLLQRRWLTWVRESKRDSALKSLKRQNQWARRYGLRMLRFAVTVLLASAVVTYSYGFVLQLYEQGVLSPPETLQR